MADAGGTEDALAVRDRAPLRVLVVGPKPPPTGGIATVVRNLLALRFATPVETVLFDIQRFPHPEGRWFRWLHAATGRLGPFGLWGAPTFWLLRAFDRALAREEPDVVHIHTSSGYYFWASGLLAWLARRRGHGAIVHFHASSMDSFYDGLGPLERRIFHRFMRIPDACVALSEAWAKWYRRFVPDDRLVVVPNCISWKRFQGGVPGDGRPRVLFVGLMYAKRKGCHDLLAVAPEIIEAVPNVEFVLAGSDDEGVEAALEVAPDVRAHLRFTGDLTPDEILALYHESSVFALPSYHEGMPMVMLEAMAAGLPVVCGNVNAIPEVVKDGENGFLLEPGDRSALARRLIELLTDAALRERIGEAARAHIREHHDLASQADRLSQLYRRVARSPVRP